MGQLKYIKWGLVCVAIFEVASLFYMLHVYDQFVSNPDNYFKNSLIVHAKQIETETQTK